MKSHKKLKILLLICCVLVILTGGSIFFMSRETAYQAKTDHIPIIGYHNLAKDEDKNKYWRFDPWTASLSSFEKQMKYLHDHGYQTISLDELYAWKHKKKQFSNKTIVITFDDSYYSTPLLAEPILKKYGLQASTFVIGYSIPKQVQAYDASKKQHIPITQLKNTRTMKYYSHFYHLHRKIDDEYAIDTYSIKALQKDIQSAGKAVNTDYFAYPFGKYNDNVQKALHQASVKMAFSYNQFRSMKRNDPIYELPRYSVNAYTPMFVFQYMINH